MDWFSRYVLPWRLSNTLDVHFCLETLEEALGKQKPDIFNVDQGTQSSPSPGQSIMHKSSTGSSPNTAPW